VDRHHPVHVSTRVRAGLPSLRGRRLWQAVRRALVRCCDRGRFRIVHFSVQGQHVHLLCEAANARALSRGVQGFKISLGRRVNAALGRSGAVFRDRYHERVIATPTQARHALAYVLNNARHHAYEEGATYPRGRVDPCSSARWFDGFTVKRPRTWGEEPPEPARAAAARGSPVAAARWWLLREGWRRGGGEISPDRVPGLPRDAPALPEW